MAKVPNEPNLRQNWAGAASAADATAAEVDGLAVTCIGVGQVSGTATEVGKESELT